MSEIAWNLSLKQTPVLETSSTSLHFGMHIMIDLGNCVKFPPKKKLVRLHQTKLQSTSHLRPLGPDWELFRPISNCQSTCISSFPILEAKLRCKP